VVTAVGESRDLIKSGVPEGVPQARRNSAPNTYQQFTKSAGEDRAAVWEGEYIFASAVARQRDITANAFELDESVIQTGFHSAANVLVFDRLGHPLGF